MEKRTYLSSFSLHGQEHSILGQGKALLDPNLQNKRKRQDTMINYNII